MFFFRRQHRSLTPDSPRETGITVSDRSALNVAEFPGIRENGNVRTRREPLGPLRNAGGKSHERRLS